MLLLTVDFFSYFIFHLSINYKVLVKIPIGTITCYKEHNSNLAEYIEAQHSARHRVTLNVLIFYTQKNNFEFSSTIPPWECGWQT